MKILITGGDGYLASRLHIHYKDKHDVVSLSHKRLDVTNESMVYEVVGQQKPDLIVHCAAISDVEACTKNPHLSFDINVNSARYIASASSRVHAKLVFCSSDQVYFKSHIMEPHLENEQVAPPHEYGRQKLRAEELVMQNNPDAVCLRLSMMYALDYQGRQEHSNFARNIIMAIRQGKPMTYAVHDFRSITDVWDVVYAMERAAELPGGIYNFGSENAIATYEVVKNLVDACGTRAILKKDEDSFAEEPRNLTMNIGKIKSQGIELPNTMDKLYKNLDKIKECISG